MARVARAMATVAKGAMATATTRAMSTAKGYNMPLYLQLMLCRGSHTAAGWEDGLSGHQGTNHHVNPGEWHKHRKAA
jgi:hypothetical protein